MNRRALTAVFTVEQATALLLAVDDHRQSRVENGQNTRALDNAADKLRSALLQVNLEQISARYR